MSLYEPFQIDVTAVRLAKLLKELDRGTYKPSIGNDGHLYIGNVDTGIAVPNSENSSSSQVLNNNTIGNPYTDRWIRFDPNNRKGIVIKKGTVIELADSSFKTYTEDTNINLSSYISEVGKDYFIYIDNSGNISAYSSYQSDSTKKKIGRFHTLCVNVGNNVTMIAPAPSSSGYTTSDTYLIKSYLADKDLDFYNFYNKTIKSITVQNEYDVVTIEHPLSGFEAGDILPESIFCLNWYPKCLYEDGMVYDKDTDKVIDIYLQSGTGHNTRSRYGANNVVNRSPYNHMEDFRMVGKKQLTDNEFTSAAIGSNEKTTIYESSNVITVGGHSDTNNRRMISAIGCEEMCGYLWQWLDEIGPTGTINWRTTDGNGSFGQEHGEPYVVYAGGAWDAGSSCGSRSRDSDSSRSTISNARCSRGSSILLHK